MSIQTTILAMVFISVMGVGLWLRIIVKRTFQIMDGHLISIRSDTTVGSRTHSETSRSM